jgi:YbgC/YbaW family acyl-CoA thioester hydrolase
MPCEHKILRRVEFSETDMAGIVHFSNYFKFMEAAEHAFFRLLGLSVVHPAGYKSLGLPRVHAHCDYLAPLRFEDEVEVHLLVEKKSARSLTYQFHLRKVAPGAARKVARGRVIVACVEHHPDGSMKGATLPKEVLDSIEVAPPARLAQWGEADPRRTPSHPPSAKKP